MSLRRRGARRGVRGVTLIELVTVIGIIGLLAAIGYPLYVEQSAKGRRASAKAWLNQVLQQEERFYVTNGTYTASMAALGYGAGPTYYTDGNTHSIALAAGPSGDIASSVTVTATAVAPDAKCATLSLSSNFAKAATGTSAAECW